MGARYEVTGAAVVLPQRSGSERYLYRGASVDGEEFTEAGIEHALTIGLIEKHDEVSDVPEGDPTDKWTVPQLKAYAETLSIDLGEATKKDDVLAVIVAAK